MSTAEVLLALLAHGPKHGYDVKRAHDDWFPDTRPLAFGQVYSTLGRLQRDGHVEVVETRVDGGPEKTVYALTGEGQQRLVRWLSEPDEATDAGPSELVRKAVALIRTGGDAKAFASSHRAAQLRRMRRLSEATPRDPVARLARDHALAHLDADLRWLEVLVTRSASADAERPPAAQFSVAEEV